MYGMRTRCMYLYIVQRLLVCHSSDCIVMYYGYTNLNILFTKNQIIDWLNISQYIRKCTSIVHERKSEKKQFHCPVKRES